MRSVALLVALATTLVACREAEDPLSAPPSSPLAPLEAADAQSALLEAGDGELEVLARIEAAGDHRFVAVLIELLRAGKIGLRESPHHNAEVVTLERLAGRPYGADWIRWVSWFGETTLAPPPGFADLKARLFARIDPGLGAFFEGEPEGPARLTEIVWDGNAPGLIQDAAEDGWLSGDARDAVDPEEPVLALAWGGTATAWPIRTLETEPVRNERIGGKPVLVVWCSLCGSGGAWSAAGEPGPRRFALAGLVYRSVPLLYDERTGTLWDALAGRARLGPLAGEGAVLPRLSAVVTTWGTWRERHSGSRLLAPPQSHRSPYANYLVSDETIFPVPFVSEESPPKDLVFGLALGLRTRAWSLDSLLEAGVVTERVAGRPVHVVATRPRLVARVASDPDAPPWSPGAEVRAYQGADVDLTPSDDPDVLLDAAGHRWQVTDAALLGPSAQRAPRLPATLSYHFAWTAMHEGDAPTFSGLSGHP